MSDAKPTMSKDAAGNSIESYKLSELSVEQLTQLSQAVGHKIDKLRADRIKLNELAAKKRDEERKAVVKAEIARLQASLDGEAPGAVIEASAAKE